MRGSYEELPCPFCDKGIIRAWYIPETWGEKRTGRSSLGSGKSITKSSEVWIIKSGCSACNKSQEEVEKRLKEKNIV